VGGSEEAAGSSGRSLEVTCSVKERNSSSYRSKGMEEEEAGMVN